MYKDLKFTMAVTVTVEGYYEVVALMQTYNLSWEEFGETVLMGLSNEVFGRDPYSKDTMYIYRVSPRGCHYFDAKVESGLFTEVAKIQFEVNQPQSVKVEDAN
jgi:hypothetical protein